jgi:hypothetical protein
MALASDCIVSSLAAVSALAFSNPVSNHLQGQTNIAHEP